jgi:choline dehydrogenase-like flavoprotein
MSGKGRILRGEEITADVEESCDVCVIGSGAGGAMLAAGLVEQGHSVVMLEAGSYRTRRDFDLDEGKAFVGMYQEQGARATADLSIAVMQGRTVGGTTTINWTTCFRTPKRILEHWEKVHGVEGLDEESLRPHFEAVEARLSIAPWPEERANANNRALLDGARKLGWEATPLRRNVKGCANSGYCGVGCPVDGKQGMHVTCIPDAIAGGMRLYADVEVENLEVSGGKVVAVRGAVMEPSARRKRGPKVVVRPKVVALCGGALNSPALLLRSGINGNGRVGKRTFLHPVVGVAGLYGHRVEPWAGAPQSIGSHQFFDRGPDKVGFFLEAAPMLPMLASTATAMIGEELQEFMGQLGNLSALLALQVDGLVAGDEGGTVSLRPGGLPKLDYPIREPLIEAFRASTKVLAQLHLAAGAVEVGSLHTTPVRIRSEAELGRLSEAEYGAFHHAIFSAHQMGGCAMGPRGDTSVVRNDLRHHELANLYVVDGSVLPTALGVNPSQTVYTLAHRARGVVGGAV